jgi:hypothetical protein
VTHITLCSVEFVIIFFPWAFANQRGGDLVMIRRREFFAGLGGATAAGPSAALAQQQVHLRAGALLVGVDL